MAAERIGKARCPLCRGVASVSLSKSQLTVLTMNCCQAQLFTRSDRSDSLVRALLLPPEQQGLQISEMRKEKSFCDVPLVPDRGIRIVEGNAVQTHETTPAPAPAKKPAMAWGFMGASQ